MFSKLNSIPYQWNPAVRAAICMAPMLIVYIMGYSSLLVPLGQGGFFYSTLPLPEKKLEKIMHIFLMMGIGLGFYLLGGTISTHPWMSIFVTFVVAVTVGILSGGKLIALVSFSLITVFTAGLNVSNPDKLQTNFMGFSGIFLFCGLLSLLPVWKPTASKVNIFGPKENLKAGVKLGVGASIALFIGNLFEFAKLGWPVSAVGSIVRFNEVESKKRAISRVIGTVGGSFLAIVFFVLFISPAVFMIIAYVFGVLHSLMSKTQLGKTVFFYTVTILILYSISDLSMGTFTSVQRVLYNLVGVLIAVFVILYPFPKLMDRVDKLLSDY